MRPLLPVLIVTAALAAGPPSALAKGVSSAEVCGNAGCRSIDEASYVALMPEGTPTDPPSQAAPFVTVTVTLQGGGGSSTQHRLVYDYLPSLGLTRASDSPAAGGWVALSLASRAALDAVVRTIQPRPAAELRGATRPAADGSGGDDGATWWAPAGAALALLALLALLARYVTSARNARPRASKSAN